MRFSRGIRKILRRQRIVIVALLLPPSTVRLINSDVFVRQDYR